MTRCTCYTQLYEDDGTIVHYEDCAIIQQLFWKFQPESLLAKIRRILHL